MRNKSEKELLPGSPEAVKAGCKCPVIDNYYGRGRGGDGARWGWYSTQTCLQHGWLIPGPTIRCTAVRGTTNCSIEAPQACAFTEGFRKVGTDWWCADCIERYGFIIDEGQPGHDAEQE